MSLSLNLLLDRLPIMKNGKPRKFRRFCECYEWTFNLLHEPHSLFHTQADQIKEIEGWAWAIWDHQNPSLSRAA